MSKSFQSVVSHLFTNPDQAVKMPLAITISDTWIWNLEFRSLGFV